MDIKSKNDSFPQNAQQTAAPTAVIGYVVPPAEWQQVNEAAPEQHVDTVAINDVNVPTLYWRDGICNCFANLWPSCGCYFICGGAWLLAQGLRHYLYIYFS